MIIHASEIKPAILSKGIKEKTLILPKDTSYKILSVKLLTIKPGFETELIGSNEERIYFVLDGRGTFVVKWLEGYWRYPVRSDMAVWIPGLRHKLQNCSDAPLRCLVTACLTDAEIYERKVRVWVIDMHKAPITAYVGGYEVMIFTPETLKIIQSTKFDFCVYGVLYPGGSTQLHVPTNMCEETMYIIRGKGNVIVANETHSVRPGTFVYIKQNTAHCEQNTGGELFEYLIFESHH